MATAVEEEKQEDICMSPNPATNTKPDGTEESIQKEKSGMDNTSLFVDKIIGKIVKRFKLDQRSVGNHKLAETESVGKDKSKDAKDAMEKDAKDAMVKDAEDAEDSEDTDDVKREDAWMYDDKLYSKVCKDSCVLVRKLVQFANDINMDGSIEQEKKLAILQNVSFAILRIDAGVNQSEMEVEEIFLTPIDNSEYISSDMKKASNEIDAKSAKNIICQMHKRTKKNGLSIDESELMMLATILTCQSLRHSFGAAFKCMRVYIAVCKALKLDKKADAVEEDCEDSEDSDVNDSETFATECDAIFEMAKQYLDLPKDTIDSDDSSDSDDDFNYDDNEEKSPSRDLTNNSKNSSSSSLPDTCMDATNISKDASDAPDASEASDTTTKPSDPSDASGASDASDASDAALASSSKTKLRFVQKRAKRAKECVRFDSSYRKDSQRCFYASESVRNVLNGVVNWDRTVETGFSFYGLDCSSKLLTVFGGGGWKYRDPYVGCYALDDGPLRVRDEYDEPRESLLKTGWFGCDNFCGFANTPKHSYCDDVYQRAWFQGDCRIKGTNVVLDRFGKKSDESNDSASNEDLCIEYVLRGRGMMHGTQDALMALNDEGTLQVWYYDKMLKKTDFIWSTGDEVMNGNHKNKEKIAEVDEHGIKTIPKIVENSWCDCDTKIEISGGQPPQVTERLRLFSDAEVVNRDGVKSHIQSTRTGGFKLSNIGNVGKMDEMLVSFVNSAYLYDLNKQKVKYMLLGGRYDLNLPRRQHLTQGVVGHNFNCVKVWDVRMNPLLAHTTINASGAKRLDTAVGFEVNGYPFVASGGCDEAITVWDLRRSKKVESGQWNEKSGALYEMSTGNNIVTQMAWHEASLTLYVVTECLYIDRLGRKYYGGDFGEPDGSESDWPERAVHRKGFFKDDYDAGCNSMYAYSFGPHTELVRVK